MKKVFKGMILLGLIAMVSVAATLTQNDKAIFNGKAYLNGVVYFKANADSGKVLTCVDSATGKASWASVLETRATPGASGSYKGFSYTKKLTTSGGSGTAIDTLTVEGTASGTALFSTIYSVSLTPVYSDTIATDIPFAYVKSIGASNKTITVRVIKGTANGPADSGTEVYMTVTGRP